MEPAQAGRVGEPGERRASPSATARSISRHASATLAAWRSATAGRSGRQRWQGRKPARLGLRGGGVEATFPRSARRAGQEGRQYTPVVATE